MSLNAVGYLYVPAACENGAPAAVACRLHVAFHGCLQYVDAIHDRFFRDAGYNAFADANHVVVLYPQATSWRRLTDPSGLTANPDGCWDWWGYAGDDARSLIGPSSFRPGSADAASARHGESISAPLRSEYPLAAVSTCNNRHAWPLA